MRPIAFQWASRYRSTGSVASIAIRRSLMVAWGMTRKTMLIVAGGLAASGAGYWLWRRRKQAKANGTSSVAGAAQGWEVPRSNPSSNVVPFRAARP